MAPEESLARKFGSVWPHLNERQRRLVAAAEARELGRGGIAAVCRAAGISRPTVELGLGNELPGAVAFGWRGLGPVPTSEPLTGQPALAPGGRIKLTVPVTQSGTGLCDIRLLADGARPPVRQSQPLRARTPGSLGKVRAPHAPGFTELRFSPRRRS